jgi:N-methylhydantoinase B
MSKGTKVEPMTLSIIEKRMQSLALEMGVRVMRAAHSYVTAHIRDIGVVIMDGQERAVAQANWSAPHVAGANAVIKNTLDYIGRDNIYPGDFIIGNDPYTVKGGHQPDWVFLYPVFYENEVVAYLFLKTHVFDTGGAYVGTYWPRAYDVHSEALIIPPTKIYERGEQKKDVYQLILKNVRGPSMMNMDIMLIRESLINGANRMTDIYQSYGKDVIKAAIDEIVESSEKMIKKVISKWPAGIYKSVAGVDCDGTTSDPVWVRLTLTIDPKAGKLILDFTESDKQVHTINLCSGAVWPMVVTPLRWCLGPGIPQNQGIYNCITLITKPGTVVDPTYPTTCGGQGPLIGSAVCECMQIALAQAVPEDIPAAWTKHLQPIFTGKNPLTIDPQTGRGTDYFISSFHSDGSAGAIYGYDGFDNIGDPGVSGGVWRSSIEIDERDFPYRWLKMEWLMDSAGHGKFRGGQGTHVEYLNLHPPETYTPGDCWVSTANSCGEKFKPFGVMGGLPSRENRMWLQRKNKKRPLHTVDIVELNPGDIIITESGGGGGVGNPLERDIEKVKEDALNEYISIKTAEEIYGVIIDPKTFQVDYKLTDELRKKKQRSKKLTKRN